MDIKNINDPQKPIITKIEQDKIDQLIKFSYNLALAYLTNKYNFIEILPGKTVSIEDLAIMVSTSLFYEDETGKTRLRPQHEKKVKDFANGSDIEFYMFEFIRKSIDHEMRILRNDLLAKN